MTGMAQGFGVRSGDTGNDRPLLELWTAGDEAVQRFAVCGERGKVLWYNDVSVDGGTHPAWRIGSAHTVAAAKAIWLAGRVRDGLAVPHIRLHLHVGNPDVDPDVLAIAAVKAGVAFDMEVTDPNPAQEWCRKLGHKDWFDAWMPAPAPQLAAPHRVA